MEGNDNYKENFLPFCSALSLCASVAFSQLVPNGVCSSPSLWVVFIEWQVVNTPPLLLLLLLQPLFYQHYSLLYFCCFELVFFLLPCSSRLAVVPIFHHFSTLDWLAPKSADSASFVSCLLLHHQVVKELHSNPLLCLFSLLFSSRFRSIVEHEKKLEEKELCTGSIAQGPNKRNKKTSSHHFSYTSRRLS